MQFTSYMRLDDPVSRTVSSHIALRDLINVNEQNLDYVHMVRQVNTIHIHSSQSSLL